MGILPLFLIELPFNYIFETTLETDRQGFSAFH